MAYGLQVFDASGNITLDTNYRITRIVQEQFVNLIANSTTTISVPGLQPFSDYACQCQAYTSYLAPPQLVIISIELQTNQVLIKTNSPVNIYAKIIIYRT